MVYAVQAEGCRPQGHRQYELRAFSRQPRQPYWALVKGGRMHRSDTVSLWCVSLLINTRFRFFILE